LRFVDPDLADRRRPGVRERVEEAGENCRSAARRETEVEGMERDQEVEGQVEVARHSSGEPHQGEDEDQVEQHRDAVEEDQMAGAERVDEIEKGAVPGEGAEEPHDLAVRVRIEWVLEWVDHPPRRAPEESDTAEARQPAVQRVKVQPERRM